MQSACLVSPIRNVNLRHYFVISCKNIRQWRFIVLQSLSLTERLFIHILIIHDNIWLHKCHMQNISRVCLNNSHLNELKYRLRWQQFVNCSWKRCHYKSYHIDIEIMSLNTHTTECHVSISWDNVYENHLHHNNLLQIPSPMSTPYHSHYSGRSHLLTVHNHVR